MKIDYATLYQNGYSSHRPSAPTDDAILVEWIIEAGLRLQTPTIVDLNVGNGQRCETFRSRGFSTFAFDFCANTSAGTRALDLATPIAASLTAKLRQEAASSRLTLCLDVLEHIGRSDLIAALFNLNKITDLYLVVRINHCPSFEGNLFHTSVLPLESWQTLLEAAGFALIEVGPWSSDRAPNEITDRMVRDWVEKNPFRTDRPFASSCLALQKNVNAGSLEIFTKRMLDRFPWLGAAPWQPGAVLEDGPPLVIHLASLQDFYTLVPLIAATPPERVSVILRDPIIGANGTHLGAAASLLRSHGYRAIFYSEQERGLDDLPEGTVLVTGAESDASQGHMLSSVLVAAARAKGMTTALLQHGIWVDEQHVKPITFTSEAVLSWGSEHEDTMREIGLVPGPVFNITGAPKYDIFACPAPPLSFVLGSWVRRWSRSALITTNLHWLMHGIAKEQLLGQILDLVRRHPEWLFLWKLHPAETNVPGDVALPANLAILSDTAMLAMQLPIQTLMQCVDVVVATQSTALLDAALCDCPSVLLQTDHPTPYQGITPISIDRVRLPEDAQRQTAFRAHYYGSVPIGQATVTVLRHVRDLAHRERKPRPEFLALARLGAITTDAFVRFASRASRSPHVEADVFLAFPFSGKSMSGKFGQVHTEVSLQNGNGACQQTVAGFLLHPNPVGQAPPILTYRSLDLTRFDMLSFDVSTGPRSPGGHLNIVIEPCGEGDLYHEIIEIFPGSKKEIRMDISSRNIVNLSLRADLPLGATSHNASGLEIRYPRLITRPAALAH